MFHADAVRRWLVSRLGQPTDIAALVMIRIAFGAVMLWEVWRYFDKGWIRRYWIEPEFHFTYLGFGWVKPWPGDGMYFHFLLLGGLAIMIALGFAYRLATVLFFLAFTYTFLLEQARYLNHFYLVILFSFLLILVPAHRCASFDTRLGWTRPSDTVPTWAIWIFRFQLGVVYVYGGIAKLNGDWLAGEPMRMWLANRSGYPLIGGLLDSEPAVWAFVYGGILFDLAIVPLLLWPRTRNFAFGLAVLFHLLNAVVWSIGIFPWMAIAMTTIFFPASWPRSMLRLPVYGEAIEDADQPASAKRFGAAILATVLAVFVVLQLLVPLRHWLYPGPVTWTEEGHMFAWRMKLRSRSGTTVFFVSDGASAGRRIDPEDYLTGWQRDDMDTKPDLILQFVDLLKRRYSEAGEESVRITAESKVSVNGRRPQRFIDPEFDLATAPRSLAHKAWIEPLIE